jgi:ABC-type arginine/histidine transport system permease subunit
MAAQRAAGEALAGTLKPQLRRSALRPGLPAAKAALVALMQNTSNAAAIISIVNLMAVLPNHLAQAYLAQTYCHIPLFGLHCSTEAEHAQVLEIGPVLA